MYTFSWPICFFRLKHGLEHHRGEAVQDFSDFQILRDRERNGLSNCVVLPELNGSIVSLSLHPSANGGVAFVDIKLYGLPDAKVEAITLSQLFPEQK